nr:branched-chain amino acid ABC transporter permease [uncultured Dysosmobacter sp.]
MKLSKKANVGLTVALVAAAAVVITLLDLKIIGSTYVTNIIKLSAIYALVGVSMNLVNGFTGLFSLGQAGFMAIGAYVVAMLTTDPAGRAGIYYVVPINPVLENIRLPFLVALILGGLVAAGLALLIGAPVLRLKSDYLAIATLGFSEIIRVVLSNNELAPFTNGSLGLKNVPSFSSMWESLGLPGSGLWLCLGLVAICIAIIVMLINSSYGRAFKAIRDNEIAAEAMGINLAKHKQMSFAIGAFFAAIGGGLLASHLTAIDPNQFKIALTYELLLIVVLGGLGSVTGTVIGAFVYTAGKEWLRWCDNPLSIAGVSIPIFRSGLRMVIFSVLLMVIVLFYNRGLMGTSEFSWNGIFGTLAKWGRKLTGKHGKEAKQ